jgi:putative SOS response-associated peptidase YedK
MCGRFVQKPEKKQWQERYGVECSGPHMPPARYNLAPGQAAALVRADGPAAVLDFGLWGLVPSWRKDPQGARPLINARAETLAEKPSFRDALRYRRCLVPANGFYEWCPHPETGRKTPFYFHSPDRPLFSFAGLWAVWNDREGGSWHTFTLVTCPANAAMQRWHHRMPLILDPDHEADWLDTRLHRPDRLKPLLAVDPALAFDPYPVSTRLNRAGVDDADCIKPAGSTGDLLAWAGLQ